jgi:kynureninase
MTGRRMGVEGHFHAKNPWMPYHEIFPKQLSKIVGCKEHEVVVMNSLTCKSSSFNGLILQAN